MNMEETQSDSRLFRILGLWPSTAFLDGPSTLPSAVSHCQGPLISQNQKGSTHDHDSGALHLLCVSARAPQKKRRRRVSRLEVLCACMCVCAQAGVHAPLHVWLFVSVKQCVGWMEQGLAPGCLGSSLGSAPYSVLILQ